MKFIIALGVAICVAQVYCKKRNAPPPVSSPDVELEDGDEWGDIPWAPEEEVNVPTGPTDPESPRRRRNRWHHSPVCNCECNCGEKQKTRGRHRDWESHPEIPIDDSYPPHEQPWPSHDDHWNSSPSDNGHWGDPSGFPTPQHDNYPGYPLDSFAPLSHGPSNNSPVPATAPATPGPPPPKRNAVPVKASRTNPAPMDIPALR